MSFMILLFCQNDAICYKCRRSLFMSFRTFLFIWHYSGKCNRGVMVAGSLKYLLPGREMSQEEEKKAIILGWCVEWVSQCTKLYSCQKSISFLASSIFSCCG